MGGKTSKKKSETIEEAVKKLKLLNTVNFVAAGLFAKTDFQEKLKLHKQAYCKKLVILTSKVINHFLKPMEISFLAQHIEGEEKKVIDKLDHKKVVILDKSNINLLDINNNLKKKRMCIGIAKFYIKIAHLFAAISMTINPRYIYIDADGQEKTIYINEINDEINIPEKIKAKGAGINFCSKRIKILNPIQNNINGIKIKSKHCNMNKKISDEYNEGNNNTKNLSDEQGIPELETLYFDIYDFNTGKYVGMSNKARDEYEKDTLKLYQLISGKKNIPKDTNGNLTIKKMSEIPLIGFHNQDLCKNSRWSGTYKGNYNDKLFKKYVEHIKQMTEKSQKLEKSLLKIINDLFVFWLEPEKQKKTITINPNLNEKKLQKLTEKTRKIILELYIGCEEDFQKGLNIFEAIKKTKMLTTAKRRIHNLEKVKSEINKKNKINNNLYLKKSTINN